MPKGDGKPQRGYSFRDIDIGADGLIDEFVF
jgi:hypothetical protein